MPPFDSSLSRSRPLAAFVTPGYLSPTHPTTDANRLSTRPSSMTAPPPGPDFELSGTNHVTDEDLVRAMAQGYEAAATALYDRTSAVLFGLAVRITGERADAEEVVVETFAQAWREAARFDATKGSVIAWLTIMTRSRALDVVRARQRRDRATESAGHEPDQPVAMSQPEPLADVALEHAERAHAVTHALGSLPGPQREAIELAFFEGLTHPEVADRLREPLGTVKTRIRLGMQKLRDALARWAPDAGERAS